MLFHLIFLAYRKCQADDFHCGPAPSTSASSSVPSTMMATTSSDLCIPKEKRCDGYLDCRFVFALLKLRHIN